MMMFCFGNVQIEDRFRYATWKKNQEEYMATLGTYLSLGISCSILCLGGFFFLSLFFAEDLWEILFPWIVFGYVGMLFWFLRKIISAAWCLYREKKEREFVHFLRTNQIHKVQFYKKFGQLYCEITKTGRPRKQTISLRHNISLQEDLQQKPMTIWIEN